MNHPARWQADLQKAHLLLERSQSFLTNFKDVIEPQFRHRSRNCKPGSPRTTPAGNWRCTSSRSVWTR